MANRTASPGDIFEATAEDYSAENENLSDRELIEKIRSLNIATHPDYSYQLGDVYALGIAMVDLQMRGYEINHDADARDPEVGISGYTVTKDGRTVASPGSDIEVDD